ncbi:Oidioi.mRNA.OKI2018_I69.chr2.g7951.t1.cds [Oikopleura dioica]|uniref:Oidioi.mRNA.OKI2018_I69.chr2.g7951.t1.cds n=1 Tax=Oikopleura dioica TaxID=34765 RepID=A0ABN7TG59_OIKDI|nr:Oidioi.mRNA.OKI2018_I69.chr2.g7951.t1.cds [Oikopleura dioica]
MSQTSIGSSQSSQQSSQDVAPFQQKTMETNKPRTVLGVRNNGVVSAAVKKVAEAVTTSQSQPKKIRKKRASPTDDTSIHSLAIDYKKKPYHEDPFSAKISGERKLLEPTAIDIDQDKDPNEYSEYAMASFEYFRAREHAQMVQNYMSGQPELSEKMRQILVDWQVEMQESFQLTHESLYLSVLFIDLYLSKKSVKRENMQLLGACAILLASKFYDRMPPYVDDLVFVCDEAYTREEILKFEVELMTVLEFDINLPVSYLCLRRYGKVVGFNMKQLTLARYVLELTLMEYQFARESASKMASAALLWTLLHFGKSWNDSLVYHTSYKREELLPLVFKLNEMVAKAPKKKLKTIYDKYSHENFFKVTESVSKLTDARINGTEQIQTAVDGMAAESMEVSFSQPM